MKWSRRTCVRPSITASVLVATWVAAGVIGLAWAIGLGTAVWMAIAGIRLWNFLFRRSRAKCVVCGYPVQSSGGPCPECGIVRGEGEKRIASSRAKVAVLASSFVVGAVCSSQFADRIRGRLPEGLLAVLLLVPTDPVWMECVERDARGQRFVENGPVRRICGVLAASESVSREHRMWAASLAAHIKPTEAATEQRLRDLLGIRDRQIATEVFCSMTKFLDASLARFDGEIATAVREDRLMYFSITELLGRCCYSVDELPATFAALRLRYRSGTLPSDVDVARFRECLEATP